MYTWQTLSPGRQLEPGAEILDIRRALTMIKIRWAVIMLLLLLSFPLTSECAQKKPAATKKPAPVPAKFAKFGEISFTDAELKGLVKELMPIVEQAAGKKFITAPDCMLVAENETYRISRQRAYKYNSKQMKSFQSYEIENYIVEFVLSLQYSFGMYDHISRKIYIMPDSIRRSMARAGVAAKNYLNIYKLILVHEMTHCIQFQNIKIPTGPEEVTLDKYRAIRSVMEGHARFIEDKIADKPNFGIALKEKDRALRVGTMKYDPFGSRMQGYSDIYLRGRDFIEWHYKNGGNEKVWEILNAPPAITSMIYHPETYSSKYEPSTEYDEVLKGLESELGDSKWEVNICPVSEYSLRQQCSDINDKRLSDTFGNIEHAQSFFASNKNTTIIISLYIMKDKPCAKMLIDLIEESDRKHFTIPNKVHKLNAKIDEMSIEIDADIARKAAYTFESEDKYLKEISTYVARGRVVVIACKVYIDKSTADTAKIPDKNIISAIEKVFGRLPAEMTGKQDSVNRSDTAP